MFKKVFIVLLVLSLFIFVSCNNKGNEKTKTDIESEKSETNIVTEKTKTVGEPTVPEIEPTETPDISDIVIKEKYEVKRLNGKLVSGEDDIYEYYLLTKYGKKELTISYTNIIEKDYYNSFSGSDHIEEDLYYYYELVFDGKLYNRYSLIDDEKNLIDSYEYLNYSKTLNPNTSKFNFQIGYALSIYPDVTTEMIFKSYSSSIADVANKYFGNSIIFISYDVNNDLAFNNNKVISIEYINNNLSSYYYSDFTSLNTIRSVLVNLSWTKYYNSLGIDKSKTSNEILNISMKRELINDINGLMIENDSNIYNLRYEFNLDLGYVKMNYLEQDNDENSLYANISNSDIKSIKEILTDKLAWDYSLGKYVFQFRGDAPKYYIIELDIENKARISYRILNTVMFEELLVDGTYEVINNNSGTPILNIKDDNYLYRFKLTDRDIKGLEFIEDGSFVFEMFRIEIESDNLFIYNYRIEPNDEELLVLNINSWSNHISPLMEKYAEGLKGKGTLYNVTPSSLRNLVTIYKFDEWCNTYLEFNGKIIELGPSFGGYGATQFAYYHKDYTNLLYFVCSFGSGIHRSNLLVYDFSDGIIHSVAGYFNKSNNYDVEFEKITNDDGSYKLAVCKINMEMTNYPFTYVGERVEMVIEDLLTEPMDRKYD